jgi:hypothetical protein
MSNSSMEKYCSKQSLRFREKFIIKTNEKYVIGISFRNINLMFNELFFDCDLLDKIIINNEIKIKKSVWKEN